jgi:hypothetical protein
MTDTDPRRVPIDERIPSFAEWLARQWAQSHSDDEAADFKRWVDEEYALWDNFATQTYQSLWSRWRREHTDTTDEEEPWEEEPW